MGPGVVARTGVRNRKRKRNDKLASYSSIDNTTTSTTTTSAKRGRGGRKSKYLKSNTGIATTTTNTTGGASAEKLRRYQIDNDTAYEQRAHTSQLAKCHIHHLEQCLLPLRIPRELQTTTASLSDQTSWYTAIFIDKAVGNTSDIIPIIDWLIGARDNIELSDDERYGASIVLDCLLPYWYEYQRHMAIAAIDDKEKKAAISIKGTLPPGWDGCIFQHGITDYHGIIVNTLYTVITAKDTIRHHIMSKLLPRKGVSREFASLTWRYMATNKSFKNEMTAILACSILGNYRHTPPSDRADIFVRTFIYSITHPDKFESIHAKRNSMLWYALFCQPLDKLMLIATREYYIWHVTTNPCIEEHMTSRYDYKAFKEGIINGMGEVRRALSLVLRSTATMDCGELTCDVLNNTPSCAETSKTMAKWQRTIYLAVKNVYEACKKTGFQRDKPEPLHQLRTRKGRLPPTAAWAINAGVQVYMPNLPRSDEKCSASRRQGRLKILKASTALKPRLSSSSAQPKGEEKSANMDTRTDDNSNIIVSALNNMDENEDIVDDDDIIGEEDGSVIRDGGGDDDNDRRDDSHNVMADPEDEADVPGIAADYKVGGGEGDYEIEGGSDNINNKDSKQQVDTSNVINSKDHVSMVEAKAHRDVMRSGLAISKREEIKYQRELAEAAADEAEESYYLSEEKGNAPASDFDEFGFTDAYIDLLLLPPQPPPLLPPISDEVREEMIIKANKEHEKRIVIATKYREARLLAIATNKPVQPKPILNMSHILPRKLGMVTLGAIPLTRDRIRMEHDKLLRLVVQSIPARRADDGMAVFDIISQCILLMGASNAGVAAFTKLSNQHLASAFTEAVLNQRIGILRTAFPYTYNLYQSAASKYSKGFRFHVDDLPYTSLVNQSCAIAQRYKMQSYGSIGIPPVLPKRACILHFCRVCGRIYSIVQKRVSDDKTQYTHGMREPGVDLRTGKMYCLKPVTIGSECCTDYPLMEQPLLGKIVSMRRDGLTYEICPQSGCGLPFAKNPYGTLYNKLGPMCAVCANKFRTRKHTIPQFIIDLTQGVIRPSGAPLDYDTRKGAVIPPPKQCYKCGRSLKLNCKIGIFGRDTFLCDKHYRPGIAQAVYRRLVYSGLPTVISENRTFPEIKVRLIINAVFSEIAEARKQFETLKNIRINKQYRARAANKRAR